MYSPVVLCSKVQRRSSTRDGPCLLQTITAPPWNGNRGIVLRRYMCNYAARLGQQDVSPQYFHVCLFSGFLQERIPFTLPGGNNTTADRTKVCASLRTIDSSAHHPPGYARQSLLSRPHTDSRPPQIKLVVCRASRCGFPVGCTAE